MQEADDLLGTTMVGLTDPRISALDDAVFHRQCLMTWEFRDAFIREWNRHWSANPLSWGSKWRFYLLDKRVVSGFELSLITRMKQDIFG